SGIEVILGKSELSILNNEIKKNKSSGIAAQFYTDTDKVGDVNIKNNIITGNSNYGLDCKAPSGGEGRPKGYWEKSMDLSSNKIIENKKKDIAGSCKFDEEKIADATKTKEEREAERLALEEKEKNKIITVAEKIELDELKVQKEQEELIAQKDREEKNNIDNIYREVEALLIQDEIKKDKIKERNKFLIFLIGEDYKQIKNLQDNFAVYDEKIKVMEDKKSSITNEDILNEVGGNISNLREKREDLANFVQERGKDFSVWGWLFEKIYLSNDKTIFGFFRLN
ncbi:MAG: Erp42 protein, partial [Candidatus Moranbacteria bacterium GW2011_GWF1_34_10]